MDQSQFADSIYTELRHLGPLEPIGVALAKFAEALHPDGSFQKEGQRWVFRKANFVTFTVHYKRRKKNILLTLRGRLIDFKDPALKAGLADAWTRDLDRDRPSYCRYKVETPVQLLAAAFFIREAFNIYKL